MALDAITDWDSDDFEDVVNSALVACYETKIARSDRPVEALNQNLLQKLRKLGPYIPKYRIDDASVNEDRKISSIDFPTEGYLGLATRPSGGDYFVSFYFKRIATLPKCISAMEAGDMYSMYRMVATNNGLLETRRFFVTVTPSYRCRPCHHDDIVKLGKIIESAGPNDKRLNARINTIQDKLFEMLTTYLEEIDSNIKVFLSVAAFCHDQKDEWVITATDGKVKAHLGCMKDEIKSLLYARDLPLTATGRKRPILHVVAAHKRRMKSGIEVDLEPFLRGIQEVVIDNTKFIVRPPLVSRETFPTSGKYFDVFK